MVVIVSYGVLMVAWAVCNPPFAAPDEQAHYLRTVGVATGEILGRQASYRNPTERPDQEAIDRQLAREVTVPPGLLPNGYECFVSYKATASAACGNGLAHNGAKTVAVSVLGTYPPLPYLMPALTIRSAGGPGAAVRIGRITGLSVCLGLLAGAVCLLWMGLGLSLLGLLVAVTPMVVFAAASMGGSGLEIAAAICFVSAMLRLARDDHPTGMVWALTGASGVVLALSRSLGPVWVALSLVLLVALVGWRGLRVRMRNRPRSSGRALGLIAVAILVNCAWAVSYGPRVAMGFGPVWESLSAGGRQFGHVLKESVRVFGYLDLNLPVGAYGIWATMTVALLATALIVAERRERRVLLGTVATAVAFPVLYYAAIARHGIGLQGRHMLPMLVIVPLLAGEVILRHRRKLGAVVRRIMWSIPAGAAAVQLLAWYANARRAAVGSNGPWAFLGHAQWQPPATWQTWLALTTIAVALLAATTILAHEPAAAVHDGA